MPTKSPVLCPDRLIFKGYLPFCYFLDPEFGLLHIRLPTWFPLTIQIYINGHEWLARQLDRQHQSYQRRDNAFLLLPAPDKAQQLADQLLRKKWLGFLAALAKRCNPLLRNRGLSYHWIISRRNSLSISSSTMPIRWPACTRVC
jgi:hypothetical protein